MVEGSSKLSLIMLLLGRKKYIMQWVPFSSFHSRCQHRSTASNLSCLRSKVAISSSTSDAETRLLDVKEDKEFPAVDDPSVDIAVEWSKKPDSRHRRFLSVASQVSKESLLLPTRDHKRQSWAGMELKGHPTAFEICGPLPKDQEELRKSQVHDYNNERLDDDIFRNQSPRLIYFNDPDRTTDKCKFSSNEIQTSKYTLLNFLPKNLFFQFQRVAYLYFLVIAALNQLPPLAVFGRTASLFPLLFVLSVTAIKDGYEDWRRHTSDKKENNREALVLQLGMFKMKKWKDIRVGEIVKICADETIPCDMVLLETSAPSGAAYIQTMNLDGESNLKTRYARQEVANIVSEGAMDSGLIRCEQPNRNVYEFTANMEFRERKFPLSQANIILRGCQLKNTQWGIGVVVYAGQETKAMLNSAASPSKRSKLERCMNRETLWLSFLLFLMCSVVALGMGLWLERHKEQLDTLPYYRKRYFTSGRDDGKIYKFYGIPLGTLIAFLSSIIVFQIMIPISLYITMELVRLGQSYFMIGDKHMYDNSSDSKFQCRALNINEDLGQIRYIFSDKTGTLTQNKMEFRTVSIFGKKYGALSSTAEASPCQSRAGVTEAAFLSRRKWKLKSEINIDPDLVELLHKDSKGDDKIAAHEFFLTLAACNTVIPIFNQSAFVGCIGADVEGVVNIDYQGESPDEQALVAAASAYGYTLFERTSGHIVLDVNGERLRLDVLGLHEFDCTRKRMSVVIRFPDNTVKLLVKGADTSVFPLLAEGTDGNDFVQTSTEDHLTEYSSLGLRTLVLAARDLTNTELEEWLQKYEDASTSLTDRSAKLRQTAALIEHDLQLLGATGVDDKLQDGVPEAVESLRQAGIKVWVLTGDKRETAISIGLSCKLLTIDMQQIIIDGASKEECKTLLARAKSEYLGSACCGDQNLKLKKDTMSGYLKAPDEPRSKNTMPWNPEEEALTSSSLALIIDGSSLVHILEKDLELELFNLAISCGVVLCCRVAPLQKAGIVNLVKGRTTDLTLAIGDGANDVSMIQMADIGVGICGQEGHQAVMASDFAMGQFRFLKRLLLVHGHWNYHRIGYLILYNFYRNAVFVLMLFWYVLYAAFSTTQALTDWSCVLYSLIYTSMPTVVVGVLDKDFSDKTLLQHPKLYGTGLRQESYSLQLFWITMLDTFWQSLVLFYIPLYTYMESTIDIWSLGSLWTTGVVILVNVHLAMDIHCWVIITHTAVWGSVMITYAGLAVLDSIPQFPNYGTIFHLAKSPTYWLTIILMIIVALLPRFLCKAVRQMFWASDIQIARENEALRRCKMEA